MTAPIKSNGISHRVSAPAKASSVSPASHGATRGAGTQASGKSRQNDEFSLSEEAREIVSARNEPPPSSSGARSAEQLPGIMGLQLRPPKVTDFTQNPEEHRSKMYVVGETSQFRHQQLCMPAIDKCVGFEPDKAQARPILPGLPVIDSPGRVATGDMPQSGVVLKSIDATPEQQQKFWDTGVAERVNGRAPDYHVKGSNCIDWVNDLFKEAERSIKGR